MAATYPECFGVLYWEALQKQFALYDGPATTGKRTRRRRGFMSVILAMLSVVLAALSSIFFIDNSQIAIVAAVLVFVMLVTGSILSFLPIFKGGTHNTWLLNRFRAERLRQLYFQTILANFDLVARAMTDASAMKEWETVRDQTFARGEAERMQPLALTFDATLRDITDTRVWLDGGPPSPSLPRDAKHATSVRVLLQVLRRQRIGVQIYYSNLNLRA